MQNVRADRTALPTNTPIDDCSWCKHKPVSRPIEGKEGWEMGCIRYSSESCQHGMVQALNRRECVQKYNRWNAATSRDKPTLKTTGGL